MLFLLASALLTVSVAQQQVDTTVTVRPGSRLDLNNFEGSVRITTWNRSAVRVEADADDEDAVDVRVSGTSVSVRGVGRYGPEEINYRITVPVDISLDITTQSGDVTISGTKGEVSVQSVEGEVKVTGGGGQISLRSVDGSITLAGARGRVDANSVDGEIEISDVIGEVRAQAVDGAITLDGVDSPWIDAETVDGAISFRGPIKDGGRYRLVSHDGDVTVTAPAINANVSVSTYSGSFESDFQVTLSGITSGKRLNFTMGTGSARLELESFDGTVTLRRSAK